MSRDRFKLTALVCALSAVTCHESAYADVLEISGGRAVWTAGGPPSAANSNIAAFDVEGGMHAVPGHAAAALTEAGDAAGPAAWRGRVAELAAKYDVSPRLLEAVVWQESRWHEGAVSPAGARGLAQLMPATARAMGIDEADPSANLEGGARYLRTQLDTFGGDVEKALAAYNAGPGRVQRAGGIPRIAETRNYVAAILSRLAEPVRR